MLSEIIHTSLDRGTELDALAKLPPDEQRGLAQRAKAGEKVSAKQHLKFGRFSLSGFGAQRVHPGEHKEKPKTKPATTSEQAQRARAEAETAKAEAAKAKAEAARARAEAARARAEAARARSENAKARADARRAAQDAFANIFDGHRERKILHSGPRELLIKTLGMLGSEHDGEILAAARAAETQRRKLGMTWEELLISADETEGRKAA